MNSFMTTASGIEFEILCPLPHRVTIEDIAASISKLCRFNGHCNADYKVAQHSCLVSHLVPPEHALQALLHDAAEAYVGDMISPLKYELPKFKQIEKQILQVILNKFGLPIDLHPTVEHADLVMLATERRDLMPQDNLHWSMLDGIEPLPKRIRPVEDWRRCQAAFLNRFFQIDSEMHYAGRITHRV